MSEQCQLPSLSRDVDRDGIEGSPRETARTHAVRDVQPNAGDWERSSRFPREVLRAAGEAGLCGMYAAREHGGQELAYPIAMDVYEELAAVDAVYAFALSVHNVVTQVVSRHGSPSLVGRWADQLCSGRAIGAFLLTESHGGSDPIAMTTYARPDGAGFRVSGRKTWVSLAGVADVYLVACRTRPGRAHRHVLLAAVDAAAPGVHVSRHYDTSVGAFLRIGDVEFDEVAVAGADVVASEGTGFQAALSAIDVARTAVAAAATGLASRTLTVALEHASIRTLFETRLLDMPATRAALADVETDILAARLLYRHAASQLAGRGARAAAAHAKRFCTDAAWNAATTCGRLLGAMGWLPESGFPRHIAVARMLQLVDGTPEIQRLVIGRDLARRPTSPG